MHTMNFTEQERIEVKDCCELHIETMEMYCKPLTRGQEHTLRVLKTFVKKFGNISTRESGGQNE